MKNDKIKSIIEPLSLESGKTYLIFYEREVINFAAMKSYTDFFGKRDITVAFMPVQNVNKVRIVAKETIERIND